MTIKPDLSVLIAVKNEARHLASTLEGLCTQLDSGINFETLVMDGMSNDNTAQVVRQFEHRLPGLRFLTNPKILASAGWNLGLTESRASKVIILSGHSHLPHDYLKIMLNALTPERAGVGGVAVPVGSDYNSRLIAQAFSSRLGNGGASFMQAGKAGPVESIAFGCYWRQLLLDVGGFDESIVRGQDWDLNMRLRGAGMTLWLEPSVLIQYTTRSDFWSLWRRQYLAGFWKYFIHRKNKSPLMLRHFIPGLFAAILTLPLLLLGISIWWLSLPIFGLLMHMLAAVLQHRQLQLPSEGRWKFWWALFIIHFAYGLGLCWGVVRPPKSSAGRLLQSS